MALFDFFKNKIDPTPERDLYEAIVAQARVPVFYESFQVPDTLDGRFELISMHVFLVLQRIKADREVGAPLGQKLHDLFFMDMDESLREMGAGDLGVGKKVKRMAQGFYGRIAAYEAALAGESGFLEDAIRRNLYGTLPEVKPESVAGMASYVQAQKDHLAQQNMSDFISGRVNFLVPSEGGQIGATP